MLLLFATTLLLKRYSAQAVPLPNSTPGSLPSLSVFSAPICTRVDSSSSNSDQRSVLNILWSCFATTFACTWVSVHPNVPWKREGKWTVMGRRVYLMFFSILAPEFVIMWAFKQWRGAILIRQTVNEAIIKASTDRGMLPCCLEKPLFIQRLVRKPRARIMDYRTWSLSSDGRVSIMRNRSGKLLLGRVLRFGGARRSSSHTGGREWPWDIYLRYSESE